jgi:hypothetical protein
LFRLNSLTTPIFNVQSYHCARVEKTSDISIDIPIHEALHVLIISSFSSSLSRESKRFSKLQPARHREHKGANLDFEFNSIKSGRGERRDIATLNGAFGPNIHEASANIS